MYVSNAACRISCLICRLGSSSRWQGSSLPAAVRQNWEIEHQRVGGCAAQSEILPRRKVGVLEWFAKVRMGVWTSSNRIRQTCSFKCKASKANNINGNEQCIKRYALMYTHIYVYIYIEINIHTFYIYIYLYLYI